jgi:hypothetical protein
MPNPQAKVKFKVRKLELKVLLRGEKRVTPEERLMKSVESASTG